LNNVVALIVSFTAISKIGSAIMAQIKIKEGAIEMYVIIQLPNRMQ